MEWTLLFLAYVIYIFAGLLYIGYLVHVLSWRFHLCCWKKLRKTYVIFVMCLDGIHTILLLLCLRQRSAAGRVVVSGCLWVCLSVCPYVPKVVNTLSWKELDVFSPNFQLCAVWDKGERFNFWGQKVKGQGHSMTKDPASRGIQSLMLCVEF